MTPPLLILLDCQVSQLPDTPGDTAIIDRLRRLLALGRRAGWNVVHSQYRPAQTPGSPAPDNGPIPSLRPSGQEPVFVRSAYSAYADVNFKRLMDSCQDSPCYLAGFGAPFSLLATAFDAAAHGHVVSVVREAIGTIDIGDRSAPVVQDLSMEMINRLTRTEDWDAVWAAGLDHAARLGSNSASLFQSHG